MTQDKYVLYGAGTIGRLIARQLIAKGTSPAIFADNDKSKWGTKVEGIPVASPEDCFLFVKGAKWVATVHRTPHRPEILEHIRRLGVDNVSLYEFLPARCDLPPERAERIIDILLEDEESIVEWNDQLEFRRNPSTHPQRPPRDISNVYFENFFAHRDDEHFVDCGAADGDTVRDFMTRWPKWGHITAFEPDPKNFEKLKDLRQVSEFDNRFGEIDYRRSAVGDCKREQWFDPTGDQTAHLSETWSEKSVLVTSLDDSLFHYAYQRPSFIKMDIEGYELEGLWGARRILQVDKPVLAICAYHLGDHLWKIPLLIHALQPEYKLIFRRYLEATWELIWYAVPPERVK